VGSFGFSGCLLSVGIARGLVLWFVFMHEEGLVFGFFLEEDNG
jgi:hypothetical protein